MDHETTSLDFGDFLIVDVVLVEGFHPKESLGLLYLGNRTGCSCMVGSAFLVGIGDGWVLMEEASLGSPVLQPHSVSFRHWDRGDDGYGSFMDDEALWVDLVLDWVLDYWPCQRPE